MGLFKFAKKAAKSAFRRAKPFIAPTVAGFAGAGAGEAVSAFLGGPTAPDARRLPPGIAAPTGLPALSIGGGQIPTQFTRPIRGTHRAGVLGGLPRGALPLVGPGLCIAGYHPNKTDRSYCVRNRRMNPLNGRAAWRAIRRIKGARTMLQKIERQLPRQRSSRRAPSGHRARLTHD